MFEWGRLVKASCGRVLQAGTSGPLKRIVIDSRIVKEGDVFVALRGDRFDGHDFIPAAVRSGAAAVIAERDPRRMRFKGRAFRLPPRVALMKVRDSLKALGRMARDHREHLNVPLIAITGSAGKTTTKDVIAAVLSARFHVLKNTGSLNNQIGLPLTLLGLTPRHEIAVVELGTNQPGDIRELTALALPDIAVYTNVGESHLEGLRTPAAVWREKKNLLSGLRSPGIVIYNADDPWLRQIASLCLKHKISYGIETPADYQARDIQFLGRKGLQFCVRRSGPLRLREPVPANILNALAAIACGRHFGIPYTEIRKQLLTVTNPAGRQTIEECGRSRLIDDTYNANPVSWRSALKTLSLAARRRPPNGRRIIVAGDMLELGAAAQSLHREVGEMIAAAGADVLVTYGQQSRWMGEAAARRDPRIIVRHYRDRQAMHKYIQALCWPGDVFLIKGSRGLHMEETAAHLKRRLAARSRG